MTPDIHTLYRVVDGTWPAASMKRTGPWIIREGQGGGQRVSAATAEGPVCEGDVAQAEDAMRALGQTPLFMIRVGQTALDDILAARGYAIVDPVNAYVGPVGPITDKPDPRALVFSIWPPLAIQIDIWATGGIGAGRIAVMERASDPKTSILGRHDHTPAASAFISIHEGIAMIHAVEVVESCRRMGIGEMVTRHAARWAAEHGATHLSALCTQANTAANALYTSLGLSVVGQYHYRKAKEN